MVIPSVGVFCQRLRSASVFWCIISLMVHKILDVACHIDSIVNQDLEVEQGCVLPDGR
jgi:hypothetical protein